MIILLIGILLIFVTFSLFWGFMIHPWIYMGVIIILAFSVMFTSLHLEKMKWRSLAFEGRIVHIEITSDHNLRKYIVSKNDRETTILDKFWKMKAMSKGDHVFKRAGDDEVYPQSP